MKGKINNLMFDWIINIKCVDVFLWLKMMEVFGEDLDDDSYIVENCFLKIEDFCCVCSKVWEKDFICGWVLLFEWKVLWKLVKYVLLSNLKKEGKIVFVNCGFVFWYYEKFSCYIE